MLKFQLIFEIVASGFLTVQSIALKKRFRKRSFCEWWDFEENIL